MDSPHQSKQEAPRAASASGPRQAFGFTFQSVVTLEMISLLEGAGVPMPEIMEIAKKFFEKIGGTPSALRKAWFVAQRSLKVAKILNKNPDDVFLLVFVMTLAPDNTETAMPEHAL